MIFFASLLGKYAFGIAHSLIEGEVGKQLEPIKLRQPPFRRIDLEPRDVTDLSVAGRVALQPFWNFAPIMRRADPHHMKVFP